MKAGATVVRGPMGFGADSRIHTVKTRRLSEDVPMIVEIVDTQVRIAEMISHFERMVRGRLVTIEDLGVLIDSPSGKVP